MTFFDLVFSVNGHAGKPKPLSSVNIVFNMNILVKRKKEGKGQKSKQSSNTPDPGYQWESDNVTYIKAIWVDIEAKQSYYITNVISMQRHIKLLMICITVKPVEE